MDEGGPGQALLESHGGGAAGLAARARHLRVQVLRRQAYHCAGGASRERARGPLRATGEDGVRHPHEDDLRRCPSRRLARRPHGQGPCHSQAACLFLREDRGAERAPGVRRLLPAERRLQPPHGLHGGDRLQLGGHGHAPAGEAALRPAGDLRLERRLRHQAGRQAFVALGGPGGRRARGILHLQAQQGRGGQGGLRHLQLGAPHGLLPDRRAGRLLCRWQVAWLDKPHLQVQGAEAAGGSRYAPRGQGGRGLPEPQSHPQGSL
mmetsp:Transcript_98382/g.261399  ORF Transcript_98382/g.261399 Transcript_98382/m.261399 type:complete len:264 (-) Transcript_98382:635-1426(-)